MALEITENNGNLFLNGNINSATSNFFTSWANLEVQRLKTGIRITQEIGMLTKYKTDTIFGEQMNQLTEPYCYIC